MSNPAWNGTSALTPTSTIPGSFSPTSATPTGTGPISFVFTPASAAVGSLNSSAPGLTNSTGALTYTAVQAGAPLPAISAVPVPPATTMAFSPGAAGQLLAIMTPVPQGARRKISPDDGRVLLSANKAMLVVGMSASTAGSTIPIVVTDTLAGSTSATLSVPVTVAAAPSAPAAANLPPLLAFTGPAGAPTGSLAFTSTPGNPVTAMAQNGAGALLLPSNTYGFAVFPGLAFADNVLELVAANGSQRLNMTVGLRSSADGTTNVGLVFDDANRQVTVYNSGTSPNPVLPIPATFSDMTISVVGQVLSINVDGTTVGVTGTSFPTTGYVLLGSAGAPTPQVQIASLRVLTPAQVVAAQAQAAATAAAAAAAKAALGSPVTNPGADGYAAGIYGPDVVFIPTGTSSYDEKFGTYFARSLAGAQTATMTGAPASFYLASGAGWQVRYGGTSPAAGDYPVTISITDGTTTVTKSVTFQCKANCIEIAENFVLDTAYGQSGYPLGDAHTFKITNTLSANYAGGAVTLTDPAGLLQLAGDPQVYTTDAAYPLASHYGLHTGTFKTAGQADQAAQFWFAQEQPAGVTITTPAGAIYDYFLPGDVLFNVRATSDAGIQSFKIMASTDPISLGLNGAVTATGPLTAGGNRSCTIRAISGSGVTTDTVHTYTVLAGTMLAPSSITMAVAQNLDNQVLYQVVGTPAVTGMGAGLKWRIIQKENAPGLFNGGVILPMFTCDATTGKVVSAFMMPARAQGHTFTLIASDGPNVCRQTFTVPCAWWAGPTVYVGRGMNAAHGNGVGYDHFSDLLPRLNNSNAWPDRVNGVATIIWAADSDPNYHANDCANGRGAFPANDATRYGIWGSVRMIAADLNGPRVRIGGFIGAPNGGGSMGGKGFVDKLHGDLYMEGFEVSWCLGDDSYHGISGVRMNADVYGDCTIVDCDFHDNDNGAELACEAGILTVDRCRATNCGANYVSSGATHGFYLEGVEVRVTRTHSYKHTNGHSCKIRSPNYTVTDCVFGDGARGTSSQMLNLPEGGTGYVARNDFHKGPNAQNPACLGYYEDNTSNEWGHISTLTLEDNRFNVLQVAGSRGGTGNGVFHFPRLSTLDGSKSQVLLNRNSFYLYGAAIIGSIVGDSGTDPNPIPMVDTNSIMLTQPFPMNFTDPRAGTGQTPGARPGFFPFTYDNETNYSNMNGVQQDPGTEEIRVPASSPVGTVLATITASGCVIYKLQNVANDIRLNPFVSGTTWAIVQTSEYFPSTWPPVAAFTLTPSSDGTSVQLKLGTGNVAGTQILKLEATAPNGTKSDWRYPITLT